MHRSIVIAAVAAIPLLLAGPANAQVTRGGSWCAGQSIGGDSWTEKCHFRSLAACRNAVLSGNRGVCFQNPYRFTRARDWRRSYARGWR